MSKIDEVFKDKEASAKAEVVATQQPTPQSQSRPPRREVISL